MSSEDDEDTIQEQEQAEGSQNHEEELKDLEAENEMSVEELRKKYGSLPPVPDEDSSGSTDASAVEEESESSSEGSDTEMDVDVDSESREGEVGLRSLLDDSHNEGESTKTDKNNDLINDAAAIAESIQPKGNTLSSTSVSTTLFNLVLLRRNVKETLFHIPKYRAVRLQVFQIFSNILQLQ